MLDFLCLFFSPHLLQSQRIRKKTAPPKIFNPCGFTLFEVEKFIAKNENRTHKYSKPKSQSTKEKCL